MESASTNHQSEFSSPYSEAPLLPGTMMVYMNYPSATGDFQQQMVIPVVETADTNLSRQESVSNHVLNTYRKPRDETLMCQIYYPSGILHDWQTLQGKHLSLNLGTETSSELAPNSNPHVTILDLNSVASNSGVNERSSMRGVENNHYKEKGTADFMARDLHGWDQYTAKMDPSLLEDSGMTRIVPMSKYLRAAQQLLDEAVNIKKVLEQSRSETMNGNREGGERSKSGIISQSNDALRAERQDLQTERIKLLTMLDEQIDRRYNQYYHQMQILETSLDSVAGCGVARVYTALALQAVSQHFRCLRDEVNCQIQAIQKNHGEQDASDSKEVEVLIPRLRYVDNQIKQQKTAQQFGISQPHTWRPQRGLPESSVSILRAWLFEHFLHPYPKDSDKIILARQAGLSRRQVSNWFINARVRLWKPMIEEMYKEEFNSLEMNSFQEKFTG